MQEEKGNNAVLSILLKLLAAFSGSMIICLEIPWTEVLSESIPTGGDIPAHPPLMSSVGEAFVNHGAIIHYSYDFWGGFEAFQFYFPLPYLIGGIFAQVFDPNITFKLFALAGILLLPPAFYLMTTWLGLGVFLGFIASLLSVSFLHTEAHVMWGGNFYSALAGMIANSWAFVFFVLALGSILRDRGSYCFSLLSSFLIVFCALSHFYGALMIGLLYFVFVVFDLRLLFKGELKKLCSFYLSPLVAGLMLLWWLVPLIVYKSYSSDFGSNWQIELGDTLTEAEKISFLAAGALLIAFQVVGLLKSNSNSASIGVERSILGFLAISLGLFFFNDLLSSTAFNNNRLWPTLYLSFYLLLLLALGRLTSKFRPISCLFALVPLYFLTPSFDAFTKATTWTKWNYSGAESKEGWDDVKVILEKLKAQKPGRISFESDSENNHKLGSVRFFEILPFLTDHEIIEGGIVNSATYPGIPYTLQCLSSHTCAGWPQGSIMPAKEIALAVEFARALGVNYHIASTSEHRAKFAESEGVMTLYSGEKYSLFEIKSSQMVEVFSSELPVVNAANPKHAILALPRFNQLRAAGIQFGRQAETASYESLIQLMIAKWQSGEGTADRLTPYRVQERDKFLNGFFVLSDKNNSPFSNEFFIADRNYDPNIFFASKENRDRSLYLPLKSSSPGKQSITYHGEGYSLATGETLKDGAALEIDFGDKEVDGFYFSGVEFRGSPDVRFKWIDLKNKNQNISLGIANVPLLNLVENISSQCNASLKKQFHKLTLKTDCPGKPHLIKYNYYPKWQAEVPIYLSTNGYMSLTPSSELTELRHKNNPVDNLSIVLSFFGVVVAVLARFQFRKSK